MIKYGPTQESHDRHVRIARLRFVNRNISEGTRRLARCWLEQLHSAKLWHDDVAV